ncbi:hypothetical protein ETB97_006096 [Aspergillus alliaceus]|uniref:Uncharacterized protein n=1 Tax=Petromyces alliaceus TaxID=209559 RepID=A0A8H6EBL2_PETAA|nr:hypothetical protein ETB97_006096 [Aspergillus burnettii]
MLTGKGLARRRSNRGSRQGTSCSRRNRLCSSITNFPTSPPPPTHRRLFNVGPVRLLKISPVSLVHNLRHLRLLAFILPNSLIHWAPALESLGASLGRHEPLTASAPSHKLGRKAIERNTLVGAGLYEPFKEVEVVEVAFPPDKLRSASL